MTANTPISRILAREFSSFSASSNDNENNNDDEECFNDFIKIRHDITAGESLSLTEVEWMSQVKGKNYYECSQFLDIIAKSIYPSTKTALQLLNDSECLETGIEELDAALKGGIRAGQLTEFVGRAGIGKTQWCLTLCAKMSIEKKKGIIYFDTERKFSPERFMEIVSSQGGTPVDVERLTVIPAHDFTLIEMLNQFSQLESSLVTKNIGLVILDSVIGMMKSKSFEDASHYVNQQIPTKHASQMKYLATTFHIPIIITNHVFINNNTLSSTLDSFSAALGNAWHHVVNVRLYLDECSIQSNKECYENNKTIKIVKSPDSIETTCSYSIMNKGVVASSSINLTRISNLEEIKQWNELLNSLSPEELEALSNG